MNTENEIIFSEIKGNKGNLGSILLNRPSALNALSETMIQKMSVQLHDWALSSDIKAVIIRGAGDRAFCAGGDLRRIYDAGTANQPNLASFFFNEYCLNFEIKQFPKPYIAFLDGITMGGGVGISVHGSHRVATEKFLFAMPETGIGFFPDVGGSYFLPRCLDNTGIYCGLTGARLKAADALHIGMVNHVMPSAKIEETISKLAATEFTENAHQSVTDILQIFCDTPTTAPIEEHLHCIAKCFEGKTVEEIIIKLEEQNTNWCNDLVKTLLTKSPMSLKITLEQLHRGRHLDFAACMQMEYALVQHFLTGHDFYEGVRALIVDKDQNPQWQPDKLDKISVEEVKKYFAASPTLLPLSDDLYTNPNGVHAEPFHLAGES